MNILMMTNTYKPIMGGLEKSVETFSKEFRGPESAGQKKEEPVPKILILDDEKKIRKIYREALESKGHDIVEAADWDSVAGLLLKHPDTGLVLLDINLPSLKGDVIYSVLRLHDPKIRVIVSSVYPIEEQKRMVCRADAYFDKSEGVEYLLEKVRVVLGRDSSAAAHGPGFNVSSGLK